MNRRLALWFFVGGCRGDPPPPPSLAHPPTVDARVIDVMVDSSPDALPDVAPPDPAAIAIFDAAIVAQGGADRLRRITTIVKRGQRVVPSAKVTSKRVTMIQYPDRMRIEDSMYGVGVNVMAGDEGWYKLDAEPTKSIAVENLTEMKVGMRALSPRLLVDLRDDANASIAAPTRVGELDRVVVTTQRHGSLTLGFDRSNRLVEVELANDHVTFSAFRAIDGVTVPFVIHHEEHEGNIVRVWEDRFSAIELDRPIAPAKFAAP